MASPEAQKITDEKEPLASLDLCARRRGREGKKSRFLWTAGGL